MHAKKKLYTKLKMHNKMRNKMVEHLKLKNSAHSNCEWETWKWIWISKKRFISIDSQERSDDDGNEEQGVLNGRSSCEKSMQISAFFSFEKNFDYFKHALNRHFAEQIVSISLATNPNNNEKSIKCDVRQQCTKLGHINPVVFKWIHFPLPLVSSI